MYFFNRPSRFILGAALFGLSSIGVYAAATEQDNSQGYEQLTQLLNQEITLLQGVSDAQTAAAAVEPLKDLITQLSQISKIVPDEQAFSLYVLRTESRKTEMNHILLALSAQKNRLMKADCFGQEDLQLLLTTQH